MIVCPNCKKTYSCGCQTKIASNGRKACASCITTLEAQIKMGNVKPEPKQVIIPQVKISK
jgi:hypothetical protein